MNVEHPVCIYIAPATSNGHKVIYLVCIFLIFYKELFLLNGIMFSWICNHLIRQLFMEDHQEKIKTEDVIMD